MKFRLRRVLVVILCLTVSLCTNQLVFADNNNTNEEQIDRLLGEMNEKLALSLLDEDFQSKQTYQSGINQIEDQLAMLGVERLSDEEVEQFFKEKGIVSTKINKPSDTNTVRWYLYNYPNYSYNSQRYDVQRLIAAGNNPGGMLITGEDNVKFYSGKNKLANSVKNAVSIYVQKAIGLIPIIQWTPYELLFSNSSSNAFNSSYVTHRCVSSIVFTYVKKSSQSDNNYSLCLFSNQLGIAVNAHGAAVINGKADTYSERKSATITADKYNSISDAIWAYNNNAPMYGYISYYDIRSYDGEYSKKAYVPNPLAGPGQVY